MMTASVAKKRPRLFRALGDQEPPEEIEVRGWEWQRVRVFKHDSWAATALYQRGERKLVCKFNRTQPILGLPAFWIGWFLAARERHTYIRLAGVEGVPEYAGDVYVAGKRLANAASHEFVPGHPLRWYDRVDNDFFLRLEKILDELHLRRIAYVDLNKRENIVVAEDGRPFLIDFQISMTVPRVWPLNHLFRLLCQMDDYHYRKHLVHFRPDLHGCEGAAEFEHSRPAWLRTYRKIAAPLREARRRLLVACGIRRGNGKAYSEQFVEEGLRESGEPDSELLRLQATLISDEYYASKGGTDRSYVVGMFRDLFLRSPRDEADWQLVRPLCECESRYHSALVMLKSTEFGIRTDRWSDNKLHHWHEQILASLEDSHAMDERQESRQNAVA